MTANEFNRCIDKIRAGDTRGIEGIYIEYYEKMAIVVQGVVKDFHAARDIASDFIRFIIESANTIPDIKYPNTWILKSVHNRAVDYVRKKSRDVPISDHYNGTDCYSADWDISILVSDTLGKLPAQDRELIFLHYEYGLKYREIADLLGVPEGTIKSNISAIKKKLEHVKKYL